MTNKNKKAKNTVFFYFGIIALLLLAATFAFYAIQYENNLEDYIEYYGYSREEMKEYMPFFSNVIPEYLPSFMGFSTLAAVLFGFDMVSKKLSPLTDFFSAEEEDDYDEQEAAPAGGEEEPGEAPEEPQAE
ncbi:MAG: hypothetical protein K5629_05385 [Eubacteriales bacterium]|nr:hypothetical protein [Eubacteriales bacterium]